MATKFIGDQTGARHGMAHQQQHNGRHAGGHRLETVIDMARQQPEKAGRFGFTGGLEFTSLTYTVVKKQRGAGGEWEKKDVDLLHEITGCAPKGCVTAVMGPSGAGKSTFLDALAGRIASLDGRVALDGVEMSPSLIKRSSAYVMQDDRLFPMLTVYETLMFAADFRLGSSVSASDKKLRVENLIEQLGLTVSSYQATPPSKQSTHELDEFLTTSMARCCSRRGTRTSAMRARGGCPAASAGVSRSAWTSSTGRRCCSLTSRRRGWTRRARTA